MLRRIFENKVVFVSGKGGTGKTTLAAALALLAARQNKRVLLIELDMSRSAIGDVFGENLSLKPVRLSAGIDGVNICFFDALQLYLSETISIGLIVAKILKNRIIRQFLFSTPFARELVFLSAVFHHYRNAIDNNGYDLIVVDLPSTGHAVPILAVPNNMFRLFKRGPLLNRARLLYDFLSDTQRVMLVLITLCEEMSVTETIEAFAKIKEELPIALGPVFINRLPQSNSASDDCEAVRELFERLTPNAPPRVEAMLKANLEAYEEHARADAQLSRLEGYLAGPFVKIFELTKLHSQTVAHRFSSVMEQLL